MLFLQLCLKLMKLCFEHVKCCVMLRTFDNNPVLDTYPCYVKGRSSVFACQNPKDSHGNSFSKPKSREGLLKRQIQQIWNRRG